MQIIRPLVLSLMLAPALGTSAHAFSTDDKTGQTTGAANFGDPDDKIPYPHLSDDGQMQSNDAGGLQLRLDSQSTNTQPYGQPSDNFNRAVDNMQK